MNTSYTLPAPAKINLHLRVAGIRADGRHELDTSFAYTDLCDRLTFNPASALHVSCSSSQLEGERNLVFRVLDALRQRYGIRSGLEVHVEKSIPEQAGLGGGSSDAATAILAANRLWELNRPVDELIAFAVPFGADIPCFLFGQTSLASGIGEKLAELPALPSRKHIALAHPGKGLPTAEVFRRFDEADGSATATKAGACQLTLHRRVDTIPARPVRRKEMPFPIGVNDLEPIACGLCPELAQLLQAMRRQESCVWMSGSGSACVALLDDENQARRLAVAIRQTGLAKWTHVGKLLAEHPLGDTACWGVAKW